MVRAPVRTDRALISVGLGSLLRLSAGGWACLRFSRAGLQVTRRATMGLRRRMSFGQRLGARHAGDSDASAETV